MTRAWPFGSLPMFRHNVILADPPWGFENWSAAGEGRNPNQHYDTMTADQIIAMPVGDLAAPDCAIFLWCVDPLLDRGFEALRRWGFRYVTVAFEWAKLNKSGQGYFMGTGYWTRANPEICLLGMRGRMERASCAVRQLIVEPIREHSRKPDRVRTDIEQLLGGPERGVHERCELFARSSRQGWSTWGNQSTKFDAESAA